MEQSGPWRRQRSWRAAGWFIGLSPVTGLVAVYFDPQVGQLAFVLLAPLCLTIWFTLDSEAFGARFGRWFALGVFFLAIVYLPAYLIRSRGPRGLLLLLPAIGILALGSLLFGLAVELAYGLMP